MGLSNPGGAPRIVALAGGVGGAKLVDGLARCLPPGALTAVVNTGDDFRYYGLAVSPDLDTVMYTLAGVAHPVNGWGIAGDTRQMVEMLARYGEESWFGLGDRDMATNLLRTHALASGIPLSAVTARLSDALGIGPRILPMTDDRVATMVDTVECGVLAFQEYFVRHRWQPAVKRLWYEGAEQAKPAPGVLEAFERATAIILCPSNPVLSIEPILRVAEIRAAIMQRAVPCIAVSPVIAGQAVKGPTAKIMRELGHDPSAAGIAAYYGDLIDVFMVDTRDSDARIGQQKIVSDILMGSVADRERVARDVLRCVRS
jgi:LPPG:FO 2-phospho-L-lactate transferase